MTRRGYPPGYRQPVPLRLDFHKLRVARKTLDISQVELSRRCGAADKAVSNWEHGHGYPSLPQLVQAARILSVPVFSLFDIVEEQ
jgi:transcriptional regulator with XRE-family HTH domain